MILFAVAIEATNSATEHNVDKIPATDVSGKNDSSPFSSPIKWQITGTHKKQKDRRNQAVYDSQYFLRFT